MSQLRLELHLTVFCLQGWLLVGMDEELPSDGIQNFGYIYLHDAGHLKGNI
jgi:hypothetical protein